jgi:hypothetical protein
MSVSTILRAAQRPRQNYGAVDGATCARRVDGQSNGLFAWRRSKGPALIMLTILYGTMAMPQNVKPKPASMPSAVSASDIDTAIAVPTTAKQLLLNLKLAWNRRWVLQPALFDEPTLLKFFNGTKIDWGTSSGVHYAPSDGEVNVIIESPAFNRLKVQMIRATRKSPSAGHAGSVGSSGFMAVDFGFVSGLTVGLVREVFGDQQVDYVNFGYATDGNGGEPPGAGVIRYDQAGVSRTTQGNQITFGVKRNKTGLPSANFRFEDDQEIASVTIAQM